MEPQKPFGEQQFPYVLVRQVEFVSELEPQLPSVLVGEVRVRRLELLSVKICVRSWGNPTNCKLEELKH